MKVCWVDDLICRPPDSNVCDREGDFCYRVYRTMSAGCIKMRWSPQDADESLLVGATGADATGEELAVPVR
jgi:hypothetical protein